jgi:DNA helicase-2/ATP-dependent DNA helicase PcrA
LFDTGLHTGLKEACTVMEGLIKAVSNETLQTLLEKVVREAGFLSHIIHSPEKSRLMQSLCGFYDHVKEESRRHPILQLPEFMNRIELMRKEGLILPLVQVSGNEKGVNLMTAHGSKGPRVRLCFFHRQFIQLLGRKNASRSAVFRFPTPCLPPVQKATTPKNCDACFMWR